MSNTPATVQGIPVTDLAEEFGTPFFLYDGDVLEGTYREVRRLLHPGVDLFFSLKANPNVSVCAVLGALGTAPRSPRWRNSGPRCGPASRRRTSSS